MEGRNCPNCGAVLDSAVCKCAYCGTSYFDISAINIDDGEPFYLKLKMRDPYGKGAMVITAFVRANPNLEISCEPETLYCRSGNSYIPFQVPQQYQLNMGFNTIHRRFNDEPHSIIFERIKE